MKINTKTFTGVGLGLIAGYLLFKNKNKKFLYIGGMGLAGGILASLVLNGGNKNQVTLSTKNYIQSGEDELFDEETGNIELEQVPVMSAQLKQTSPEDYYDIDLGLPNN